MGMQTAGRVEIAKPAAEVFTWLVDPAKLTQWAGGPGLMPADPAALHAGFEASGPLPALAGEARMRIETWDPPLGYSVTMTYAGGNATTTYALSASGEQTTLTCTSDTDWGRPDLSAMEVQMAQQSPEIQAAMHHAIDLMNSQVAAGSYDATAQQGMQAALEQSLAKLKALVES
jgi:uncharacterized protein YndB with AHSA1/START domain